MADEASLAALAAGLAVSAETQWVAGPVAWRGRRGRARAARCATRPTGAMWSARFGEATPEDAVAAGAARAAAGVGLATPPAERAAVLRRAPTRWRRGWPCWSG